MEQLFMQFLNAVIWLAFPICGLIGWIYYVKARNEERKLWIERGVAPSDLIKNHNKLQFPWLKLGLVILGLGVGLLTIAILINFDMIGHSDAIYPAILCLGGGMGLIVAHCLKKHQ